MCISDMLYVHCMWADTEFCCGWLQEMVEAAALVVSASIVDVNTYSVCETMTG